MRTAKTASRWVLGVFFIVAGTMHFIRPAFYLRIMPPYLPLHRELVELSGVLEIVLGAMVLFRRSSRLAAWGLILLLIAVFPANIYLYQHQDLVPMPAVLHLLRLPLQGVFIAWAFWHTRPETTLGSGAQNQAPQKMT